MTQQTAVIFQVGKTTVEVGEELIEKLDGTFSGVYHDFYGAPYIKEENGIAKWHISLTDEGNVVAGMAVSTGHDSVLAGIGIDIVSISDFHKSNRSLECFLYYTEEIQYFSDKDPYETARVKAIMFSVKESALKSMADSMRPFMELYKDEYDYVEFRQFKIIIKDEEHAIAIPTGKAAKIAESLQIREFKALYYVKSDYAVSVVISFF